MPHTYIKVKRKINVPGNDGSVVVKVEGRDSVSHWNGS
jgi:hypothetical protein